MFFNTNVWNNRIPDLNTKWKQYYLTKLLVNLVVITLNIEYIAEYNKSLWLIGLEYGLKSASSCFIIWPPELAGIQWLMHCLVCISTPRWHSTIDQDQILVTACIWTYHYTSNSQTLFVSLTCHYTQNKNVHATTE